MITSKELNQHILTLLRDNKDSNIFVSSYYFFQYGDKTVYITQNRKKYYEVNVSGSVKCDCVSRKHYTKVLFYSPLIEPTVAFFRSTIKKIFRGEI